MFTSRGPPKLCSASAARKAASVSPVHRTIFPCATAESEIGLRDLIHAHDMVDDGLVVWREHLPAGGPVDLDRVIARRIVARRDHDAAGTMPVSYEKRQFGRAAIIVQQVNLETGGHHDAGTQFREVPRAVSRVVGDGARASRGRTCLRAHVGCQPLSTFADRAIVDGIGSDGVHASAPTASSEGNYGPEDVIQLLPVVSGNMLDHR